MLKCYELKPGQKIECVDCGFQLEVTKACSDGCGEDDECCELNDLLCCGKPMRTV
jgi:hypothetical protein